MRTCSKCSQSKPVDEFYVARREKSGRQSECIDCLRERRGNTKRVTPKSVNDIYRRSWCDPDTNCIEWRGHITNDGYGRTTRGRLLHRLVWGFEHGPIPDGFVIHHECRNRKCVNLEHLCLLTVAEHSLLHNLGDDVDTCRNGHSGDWYVSPAEHRRCRECVRIRRRRYAIEGRPV